MSKQTATVPCANPHCRYKVTMVDGVPFHVFRTGRVWDRTIEVLEPTRDSGAAWVPHDAAPAVVEETRPTGLPRPERVMLLFGLLIVLTAGLAGLGLYVVAT